MSKKRSAVSGQRSAKETASIVAPQDFAPVAGSKCTCGHIACVCNILTRHKPECRFLIAATGPVGIECEHGYDCCPKCDPCTCGAEISSSSSRPAPSGKPHPTGVRVPPTSGRLFVERVHALAIFVCMLVVIVLNWRDEVRQEIHGPELDAEGL